MNEHDFSFKSQDVDYLGFLEAQLRDLQGIHTLAFELIQNADDVKDDDGRFQTTTITFDITDDALIVENNGVFRDVDFARLQNLAGGGKREEAGTTGAFGIGFTAVYQITDAPQIFSHNRHWIIHPAAPPDQRIRERKTPTSGTRFVLPWAFDGNSPIRRALRIDAVQPDQLDAFVVSISKAIQTAALFLTQLDTLTVLRNGRLVAQIKRTQPQPNRLHLENEAGVIVTWLLLTDGFAAEAERLRTQYAWQIEEKRHSEVRLALPTAALDQQGRLYAVLPTDSMIPIPIHINADFYPTTDRKRIHFKDGYQAEWNQAAIHCAAQLLANQLHTLPHELGAVGLWQLLQKSAIAQQMAAADELPAIFAAFWHQLAPHLTTQPILLTAGKQWVLPTQARLLPRGVDDTAVSLLTHLHIPVIHPDLLPFQPLLAQPEVGTPTLTIEDIADALVAAGLTQPTDLMACPPFLRSLDAWQTVWQIIERLLSRIFYPEAVKTAQAALQPSAVVLTESMMLTQFDRVYQGNDEAKQLFPDVNWLHTAVSPATFPGSVVQRFGARHAVDLLKQTPVDQLEYKWRMGQLDLPALFRWFESQQIEIFADDPSLQHEIGRLPLCPVAGQLRPLNDLYIPGGFNDPLDLAGLVDLDAMGGRAQFLHDLGARELDFDTYISIQMPRMLAQHTDIPSDARHQLIQLLAERLGEFRDDLDLRAQLADLPLVACMDGTFRPAYTVYASRDVISILGDQVHVAEPVEGGAVQALHHWLGVRERPSSADLVQTVLMMSDAWGISGQPLDVSTTDRLMRCWVRMNDLLLDGKLGEADLVTLNGRQTIPNQQRILMLPAHLFLAAPDTNLAAPDTNLAAPDTNPSAPDTNLSAPDTNLSAPDTNLAAPDTNLAAQFTGLTAHLLPFDENVATIWRLMGVRRLEDAVTLTIRPSEENVPDDAVRQRIVERLPLMNRVFSSEGVAGETAVLANIRVMRLPQVLVQVQLAVADEVFRGEETAVSARWDAAANILYFSGDIQTSWTAVARELITAVSGAKAKGSLAVVIREILTPDTFAAASHSLDELGY